MANIEQTFGISKVIAKYLTGVLDANEQARLDAWLAEDALHPEVFARIIAQEDLAAALIELEKINPEAALAKVNARIAESGEQQPARQIRLWPRNRVATVAAAAVAALALFIYFFTAPRHLEGSVATRDLLNDVAPGRSGATITLAGGHVIELSGAKKGVVIGNGTLVYDDGSALSPGGRNGRSPERGNKSTAPSLPMNRDRFSSGGERSMMLTASTSRGQMYEFTLPDGTHVWLNADSKISFPSQFTGKERKILLSGEAYFAVVHNAKQPFRVESKGQVVEDIGTEFNINAYADESSTKTTLVEGSALVRHLDDSPDGSGLNNTDKRSLPAVRDDGGADNGVVLKPNQQAILNKSLRIIPININAEVDWKNGDFVFNDESLESILRKVARWYDVDIIYQDKPKDVSMLGAVSRSKNVSAVLHALEQTGKVHFKIEGRRITVMR